MISSETTKPKIAVPSARAAILYVLLRKFLFKPIQNVLDQRQKMIEADIAAAKTSKTEAAAALTTAQDKLRNVDNEAAARREASKSRPRWKAAAAGRRAEAGRRDRGCR